MSRRMRRSDRRSSCASLGLERLEDRQLLSGWSVPALSQSPPWAPAPISPAPAVSHSAAPQPSASWSTSPADSQSEADETYSQQPASSAQTTTDSAGAMASNARAAAAANSSSDSAAAVSAGYGGGSYSSGLVGGGSSAGGAASESAFSYYGQQPFYRLPPDQISAFRATGVDIPQATVDSQALATLIANQDNPNGQGRTAAADAVARRNAEVLVVAANVQGILEQRPILGDSRTVPATAQADEEGLQPSAVAVEPSQPDALAGSLVFSMLPSAGQVAVGMLPVDLPALERGVEQFFGQVAKLGEHVSDFEVAQRLAPWLVAVALSTAALETARWRFWKPAAATPVLTSSTRGFSTVHPSGTDPFPDIS